MDFCKEYVKVELHRLHNNTIFGSHFKTSKTVKSAQYLKCIKMLPVCPAPFQKLSQKAHPMGFSTVVFN